jgi:hypothetical protein
MSALGHKRTFRGANGMSALPPESGHLRVSGDRGERGSVEADLLWALVAVQGRRIGAEAREAQT